MQNDNGGKKPYIYEIDLLRALTVFSVVTIHTLSTTTFLYANSYLATVVLNLLIHSLHYSREIFVFVTGLVLTYVYYNRSFSAVKFWTKRFLLIFIPYILWSIIYIIIGKEEKNFWLDIITGNASYQLYYILLALQYYALFPLFLWFIKRVSKHPLIVLLVSFFIQIVLIYLDFTYIQKGTLTQLPIVKNFLLLYQDRIFITYQFFFFLGGITALYFTKAYKLIVKYGKVIPYIFIVSIACYALYYFHQLNIKDSIAYTTSALQPSVVLYSTVIIVLFSWFSVLWVKKMKLFSLVKSISNASFGIFFVHILILNFLAQKVLPLLSSTIPAFVKIFFVDITTFLLSLVFCLLLLRTPILSWIIGSVKKTS